MLNILWSPCSSLGNSSCRPTPGYTLDRKTGPYLWCDSCKNIKIMMTTFRFNCSNLCIGSSVILENQHYCCNQNDKMVLEYVLLERPVPLFSSGHVPWMSIPWTSGLDTPTSSYICTCICTTLLRSQVTRPTTTSKWFGESRLQKNTNGREIESRHHAVCAGNSEK